MKKRMKVLIRTPQVGHNKIERPLSLLIVLWLTALLIIGVTETFFEQGDEMITENIEEVAENEQTNK